MSEIGKMHRLSTVMTLKNNSKNNKYIYKCILILYIYTCFYTQKGVEKCLMMLICEGGDLRGLTLILLELFTICKYDLKGLVNGYLKKLTHHMTLSPPAAPDDF